MLFVFLMFILYLNNFFHFKTKDKINNIIYNYNSPKITFFLMFETLETFNFLHISSPIFIYNTPPHLF